MILGLLIILSLVSGLGPLMVVQVKTVRAALKLGTGAQGTLKGLTTAGREAT